MKKTKLFSVLLLGLLVAGGTSALAIAHDDSPIRTEAATAALPSNNFTFLIKDDGVSNFDKLKVETFDPSNATVIQEGNTVEKVDDTTYKVTILNEHFRNKNFSNVAMKITAGDKSLIDEFNEPAVFNYQPIAALNNTKPLEMLICTYGKGIKFSIDMRSATPTTKPSPDTTRLWFNFNNDTSYGYILNSNGDKGAYSFVPGGKINFGTQDKPLNYVYYDVPFTLLDSTQTHLLYKYYGKISSINGLTQSEFMYLDWRALHYINSNSYVEYGPAFDSTKVLANKSALAEVFKPYYTCLDNNYNGFGAIKRLTKYWIDCSGLTEEELNAIKIMDFAKNEDYATDTRSSEITLNQKINEMTNQYNIKQSLPAQGYLPVDDQKMITVIIATSISAITAIALVTFTIARKKRLSK